MRLCLAFLLGSLFSLIESKDTVAYHGLNPNDGKDGIQAELLDEAMKKYTNEWKEPVLKADHISLEDDIDPLHLVYLIHESSRDIPRHTKTWPRGVIKLHISSSFNRYERQKIQDAMDYIKERTCIRFRKVRRCPKYRSGCLYVKKGNKCSSSLGVLERWGRRSELTLKRKGCFVGKVIVHEFMHAIGFTHEHNRRDRDEYVKIHWENIPGGRNNHNYDKKSRSYSLGLPYDYYSIMHYDQFIGGKKQFTPKKSYDRKGICKKMGQICGMTTIDVEQINLLYKCKNIKPKACQDMATKDF